MAEKITEVKEKKKGKRVQDCFWKQCMIFIAFMTLIVGGYSLIQEYIRQDMVLKNIIEDDFTFVFQIDEIKEEGSDIVLEGWSFKLNVDATEYDMEVLLYDMESERIVYPKIEEVLREDVNEYFLCEYDYTKSGFIARFNAKNLDLMNKDYEIIIFDKKNKKKYRTETFISQGQQMYCSPIIYSELEVAGTDLEPIVRDGILRVYRPDVGMYVYQYEGNLYWIADEIYEFEVDGSTLNQYHLWTTQIAYLPKHRLENEWYWDNMGFFFENNELSEYDYGVYRVSVSKIPEEYSITKIMTGYYEDDWVWQQYFRLWYEFENCSE